MSSLQSLQLLRSILLRAADRYAYRLWKHCLFCRDCLERRDIYILLALALLCWRRPISPHRRSPRGDHSVDHALPGLTPSTANFPTNSSGLSCTPRAGGHCKNVKRSALKRLQGMWKYCSILLLGVAASRNAVRHLFTVLPVIYQRV